MNCYSCGGMEKPDPLHVQRIRKLDFERIVPGHGEVITVNAKQAFEEAFSPWLQPD